MVECTLGSREPCVLDLMPVLRWVCRMGVVCDRTLGNVARRSFIGGSEDDGGERGGSNAGSMGSPFEEPIPKGSSSSSG